MLKSAGLSGQTSRWGFDQEGVGEAGGQINVTHLMMRIELKLLSSLLKSFTSQFLRRTLCNEDQRIKRRTGHWATPEIKRKLLRALAERIRAEIP